MRESHRIKPVWNKNLTKETDERVRKYGEKQRGKVGSMLGKHHTQTSKDKISESQKGEKGNMYGKHHSQARKEKISNALKDKPFSEEHKLKISQNAKTNPNYGMKGKFHSQVSKDKMSRDRKGNHHSLATIEKMKISHKKVWENPERHKPVSIKTREKLGKASKRMWEKEGFREMMSEFSKERWENPEYRKKMCELSKGKNNGMYGKHHNLEAIEKIRKRRLYQIFPIKDTKIEVKMQNALEKENIIFEKHKFIFGQPDIFIEPNICIFCDGDYFHANPSIYKEDKIILKGKTAKFMWERDNKVNKFLEEKRYIVLRFWGHEINNNINNCIEKINSVIKNS